jgi:peroxiredoxin
MTRGDDEVPVLASELEARRRAQPARLSLVELATLESAIERLRMLQLAEFAVATGDPFPDFALPDDRDVVYTSDDLLARGPLVVAFFRGGFCPYCDAALRAYDRLVEPLRALGAMIVGVLPERPEVLAETRTSKGLIMPLLSDAQGRLARLVGVHYEMTEDHAALYRAHGVDLEARNAGSGWALVVPAVFVVAVDGEVAYAFAEPDYTRRAEPAELLVAVAALAPPAGCARRAGRSARSTKALTGGEYGRPRLVARSA